MFRILILAAIVALTSCSGATTPTQPSPIDPSPQPSTDSNLQFCVAETNRLRATVGRSPLSQSATLEAFAAAGAQVDSAAALPHTHFNSPANATNIALAENEVHRQPYALYGSTIRGVIAGGLADYWIEGPNGGHYQNIIGPYTQLGCAVFLSGNGLVTFVQDFR